MSAVNIFGQKRKFAIEVKREVTGRGSVAGIRIWVNGKNFGKVEDEGVIGVSVSAFLKLILPGKLACLDDEILGAQSGRNFDYTSVDDALKFDNAGESFDDFYVLVGRRGEDICFFWTLTKEPFYQYPANQFLSNCEYVNFEYFKNVVIAFKDWVELH